DYIRRSPKLRDNTLVVLMSDNGPEPGAGSAAPLRGSKGTLFEGGIREPLIVWGPGFVPAAKAGSVNETSVLSSVDLAASLLRLAGAQPPPGARPDGADMADTLTGKATASRREPLFWKRPPDRPGPPRNRHPDLAVREGDWKLLVDEDGSRARLYDLGKDPGETTDLAAAQPEVVERLKKRVLAWDATLPGAPAP
ncbi:MAG TPA: sulfatase-like hydrolase/transferase, partial [Armatimonadota bacterium]|nr:sulfatase-like hydrolase/transferase [Armatimonadota bacterium]